MRVELADVVAFSDPPTVGATVTVRLPAIGLTIRGVRAAFGHGDWFVRLPRRYIFRGDRIARDSNNTPISETILKFDAGDFHAFSNAVLAALPSDIRDLAERRAS